MDADLAKGLCLFFLFIDTLIFGWPIYFLVKGRIEFSHRQEMIRATIISYLTCFSGGVFMGACLLHMLAEGREDMEDYFKEVNYDNDFPIFETLAATGFFIIAAVEMIAHGLLHRQHQVNFHDDEQSTVNTVAQEHAARQRHAKNGVTNASFAGDGESGPNEDATQETRIVEGRYSFMGEGGHDHHSDLARAMQSAESDPLRAFLLLAALSFHTVFDGLAVGLADSGYDVWQMFTAICIHKSLVAVCLGSQLFLAYKDKPIRAFLWIFFFSVIAPIGVGIGMILTSGGGDDLARELISWILQAIATGTFLYVTFFEILRDELSGSTNLLKLVAVILGFGGMALAKYFDKD